MKRFVFLLFIILGQAAFAQDAISAARTNDVALLAQLKSAGTDMNKKDGRGFTPLIIAVYNNSYEAALYLIEDGADVNAADSSGNTALMGAAFKGYTNLAALLVKNKANVNLANYNKAPALIFAVTFGQTEIVKMLLAAGADTTIKDAFGKTALDHARIQENEEMIALLEQ
jgi:uncharacterized protein|nr:ankyrin repeat domain-containing protein [uncultured Flavobacterium sp.]